MLSNMDIKLGFGHCKGVKMGSERHMSSAAMLSLRLSEFDSPWSHHDLSFCLLAKGVLRRVSKKVPPGTKL